MVLLSIRKRMSFQSTTRKVSIEKAVNTISIHIRTAFLQLPRGGASGFESAGLLGTTVFCVFAVMDSSSDMDSSFGHFRKKKHG